MKMENENNSNEDRIMYLQQRKKALTQLLQEKNELLKRLCLQEADITGVIPSEIPEELTETTVDTNYVNDPNVNLTLRRKVETGFKLSENLLANSISNDDDEVSKLLLEKQVQTSIAEAALNMANNLSNNKAVRRKHRHMYKQSQEKLVGLNETLSRKVSQASKPKTPDVNVQQNNDDNVVEENYNHITNTLPIVQHNGFNATNSRFSDFIPDNYYAQHIDPHILPLKDINKYPSQPHGIHGDSRYMIQNHDQQLLYNHENIVSQNYYPGNNKMNQHIHNKSRKKPRPPVDEYSIKRDHISLSLPKYNIDNHQPGYVDQLHNQISEYRNTIASEPFFTYPRKDHYQNHIDESSNHNQDHYYEQEAIIQHPGHHKNRPIYNLNHQSDRNLFGSLDRRKVNVSPMLVDNMRNHQKIKISNRSHSIGELKMAEDVTDNVSIGSHNSGNTPKERQWHETSLDEQPLSSPIKQRVKPPTQYDVTGYPLYNDRNRTPVTSIYNYDYVDTQYLQKSPITALNQNYENMYEKNNPSYIPTPPPTHMKQLPIIPQPQMVVTKPAMPSPTSLPYYEQNREFPNSPVREPLHIELASSMRNGNEPKQFLSPKTVPVESPKNIEVISPGTWCPYKEVSKPFEMSDFYKYSTKFRNKQVTTPDVSNIKTNVPIHHVNKHPELKSQCSDYVENNVDPIQKGVYQPLRPLKCQPFLIQGHNVETG